MSRNDIDVVNTDQAAVGDDTDGPDSEPGGEVVEHTGQVITSAVLPANT